jgi:hypothetical protein
MFSTFCFVAGLGLAHNVSATNDMTSLGVAILCFGIVFWLSKSTYQNSKKVMMYTVAIIAGTGVLAWFFVADLLYYFTGFGFYCAWELCALLIGTPVMAYVFKNDK